MLLEETEGFYKKSDLYTFIFLTFKHFLIFKHLHYLFVIIKVITSYMNLKKNDYFYHYFAIINKNSSNNNPYNNNGNPLNFKY